MSLLDKGTSIANVSEVPIYFDIQTDLFKDFRIRQFSYPEIISKNEDSATIITWGDISTISEQSVISHLGFTIHALKIIKYLWQLKDQAVKIENTIMKGLPIRAYNGFEQIVDAFALTVAKNDREKKVLKGRLGLLDGRKWTLEELGQAEDLTRERIRQIENILIRRLDKRKVIKNLALLWFSVDEMLTTGGGVCCVSEIAEALAKHFKWMLLPCDEALASLISLSAHYEVVWNSPIRIIMPNHKCLNCKAIVSSLAMAIENQATGTLSFGDAIARMKKFCQHKKCENDPQSNDFSKGYLHFIEDSAENILVDEILIYSQYAWAQKYGKRKLLLVETILRNAGRPMHFTEVHAEVNKDRPSHGQISERNIHACIARSSDLLLWDRGTYIHREHVLVPSALIKIIENEIISRLNCNIPYLLVNGIFELFKADLLKNNVPSESALYSCLRESNNKELKCPKYPKVMKTGSDYTIPVPLLLEEYALNQERIVTYTELRNYAVETLCVNEANFVASYSRDIPNLLHIDRGEYLHLHQLGIQKDKLLPIIVYLTKLLENYDHVSAEKIFEDKKITCKMLGIFTPMLLFSLIQFFYFDQFDLSRYPQIRIPDVATGKNRTAGVASDIINYIREKALPCSFAELYEHFVDELGYKQNSVHAILYTYENILRLSNGVIVHSETLHWSEDKQTILETLAARHLNIRKSAGKPYGLVSHLYDYMYDELPELPHYISWTTTLIGELLSHSAGFNIIGSSRDAFVPIPNSYGIDSLDDLFYYILKTEYSGAANIDKFISDMREAGILKKSLTTMMLGADSRVTINGNVVQLAELSARVERT